MIFEPLRGDMFFVINQSDHRDGGGRIDNASRVLIIQRNISACDRRAKRATRFCYSFNCLTKLPEVLWLVRITEVQAIGHSKCLCTGTSEIARRFGDRNFATFTRVERAISRLAIRGSGEEFVGVTHEDYRGVRTGFYNRSSTYGVIVLAIDPILGCNRRIAKQLPKSVVRVDLL